MQRRGGTRTTAVLLLHVQDTVSEKQHLEFNSAVTAVPAPLEHASDGEVQKNHSDHQMKQKRDPSSQKASVIQKSFTPLHSVNFPGSSRRYL